MKTATEYLSSIESEFKQFRKNVWISPNLSTSTPVFRYTSFENLLSILNGDIHIPKRRSFTDRREHGEYQSDEIRCIQAENILTPKRNEIKRRYNNAFELSKSFPVSCWTLDENESFIDALQINTGQKIYCSNIHYGEGKYPTAPIDILFYKDMGYCMESELRFYVVDDVPNNGCKAKEPYFRVNERQFLNSVTFSPLIPPKAQNELYKLITNSYGWLDPDCSKIMEY